MSIAVVVLLVVVVFLQLAMMRSVIVQTFNVRHFTALLVLGLESPKARERIREELVKLRIELPVTSAREREREALRRVEQLVEQLEHEEGRWPR